MPRRLAACLVAGSLLWSLAIVIAPAALESGSPRVVTAAAVLYSAAGLICHQRPERSFHLSSMQLPVCARCSGLYVSGAIGALAAWIASRRRARAPRHTRALLAIAALPTAATFSLEFAGLITSSNAIRATAALPLGATAAWIFVRSLLMSPDRR